MNTKESTVATNKPDKPADDKPAPKKLLPAATATDPAVHKLLADRETHRLNSQPDPGFPQQRDEALAAIERIDAEIEELGYTAR